MKKIGQICGILVMLAAAVMTCIIAQVLASGSESFGAARYTGMIVAILLCIFSIYCGYRSIYCYGGKRRAASALWCAAPIITGGALGTEPYGNAACDLILVFAAAVGAFCYIAYFIKHRHDDD